MSVLRTSARVAVLIGAVGSVGLTLYAPGLLTGHSRTGIDSLSDSQFLHALIKGSAQLGCFPDGLGWRFIPVDRVARDVVSCLLSPASINHDIYLDSTNLLSPEVMVETLRRFGFDVRVVPYAAWRSRPPIAGNISVNAASAAATSEPSASSNAASATPARSLTIAKSLMRMSMATSLGRLVADDHPSGAAGERLPREPELRLPGLERSVGRLHEIRARYGHNL